MPSIKGAAQAKPARSGLLAAEKKERKKGCPGLEDSRLERPEQINAPDGARANGIAHHVSSSSNGTVLKCIEINIFLIYHPYERHDQRRSTGVLKLRSLVPYSLMKPAARFWKSLFHLFQRKHTNECEKSVGNCMYAVRWIEVEQFINWGGRESLLNEVNQMWMRSQTHTVVCLDRENGLVYDNLHLRKEIDVWERASRETTFMYPLTRWQPRHSCCKPGDRKWREVWKRLFLNRWNTSVRSCRLQLAPADTSQWKCWNIHPEGAWHVYSFQSQLRWTNLIKTDKLYLN